MLISSQPAPNQACSPPDPCLFLPLPFCDGAFHYSTWLPSRLFPVINEGRLFIVFLYTAIHFRTAHEGCSHASPFKKRYVITTLLHRCNLFGCFSSNGTPSPPSCTGVTLDVWLTHRNASLAGKQVIDSSIGSSTHTSSGSSSKESIGSRDTGSCCCCLGGVEKQIFAQIVMGLTHIHGQ